MGEGDEKTWRQVAIMEMVKKKKLNSSWPSWKWAWKNLNSKVNLMVEVMKKTWILVAIIGEVMAKLEF